jgi:hypothetical protein
MNAPSTSQSTRFLALLLVVILFWSCTDHCESCKKCPDRQETAQEGIVYNGTVFKIRQLDSLRFRHIKSTDVIIEGKLLRPDHNPLLLYLFDKDKLIIQHGAVDRNETIEIEVLEKADHLISMSLPFNYALIHSCEDGEPRVRVSGHLQFEDNVNHNHVTVFDVADENNRVPVDEDFGFEISLMRQRDNSCKVSLGIAYEVRSKPYVQKSTFGNITDLDKLTVVLGDRVREVDFVRTPRGGL